MEETHIIKICLNETQPQSVLKKITINKMENHSKKKGTNKEPDSVIEAWLEASYPDKEKRRQKGKKNSSTTLETQESIMAPSNSYILKILTSET